jgi:hypothetical protein
MQATQTKATRGQLSVIQLIVVRRDEAEAHFVSDRRAKVLNAWAKPARSGTDLVRTSG